MLPYGAMITFILNYTFAVFKLSSISAHYFIDAVNQVLSTNLFFTVQLIFLGKPNFPVFKQTNLEFGGFLFLRQKLLELDQLLTGIVRSSLRHRVLDWREDN